MEEVTTSGPFRQHHLASLIRAKMRREGSPATTPSKSRRVVETNLGEKCCWLCSKTLRKSNCGESVLLVGDANNSASGGNENCPCLCASCFLVAYLTLRDSFPSSQQHAETRRQLEATFDAEVEQLLVSNDVTSLIANAADNGLGMSQSSTIAGLKESLFVNSYSLRSFVAVDPDGGMSEVSSPPPMQPSKTTRVVATPPSVIAVDGEWQCPRCSVINAPSAGNVVRCAACGGANPDAYPCHCCGSLLHPRVFLQGKAPLRCAVKISPPAPPAHLPSSQSHRSPQTSPRLLPPSTRPRHNDAPPLLFDNSTQASSLAVNNFVERNVIFSPLAGNGLGFTRRESLVKRQRDPAPQPLSQGPVLRHQLWVCDGCTLVNVRATKCCEMCGGARQVPCGKCTYLNHVAEIQYDAHATRVPSIVCEMCSKTVAVPDVDPRLQVALLDPKQPQGQPLDVSMTSSMMREARRSDEIVKGEKRLRHRVERLLGAFMRVQVGDGSCLFRAIADELFAQSQLHQVVRHLICTHMASAEARGGYSLYFESEEDYNGYLQRLSQDGTWGDELCIHAASQLFHVTVTVISSMEAYWAQTFAAPADVGVADENTADSGGSKRSHPVRLFLAYTNPVHFDSIRLERGAGAASTDMMDELLQKLNEALLEERQWDDAGHVHHLITSGGGNSSSHESDWHVVHMSDHHIES